MPKYICTVSNYIGVWKSLEPWITNNIYHVPYLRPFLTSENKQLIEWITFIDSAEYSITLYVQTCHTYVHN